MLSVRAVLCVYHVSTSNRRDSIVNAYPFVLVLQSPGKNVSPGEGFELAAGAPGQSISSICGLFSTNAGYIFWETRRIGGRASLGVDYASEYIDILLIKKINFVK